VLTDTRTFEKKFDLLDPSFMCTQIMKEILLTIKFEDKHIQEFIDYCRTSFAGNDHDIEKSLNSNENTMIKRLFGSTHTKVFHILCAIVLWN
jgi:hypothetical protein